MVFEQSKRLCNNEFYQFSYKQSSQTDSLSNLAISQSMGASEIPSASCEDVSIIEQALGEHTSLFGSHIRSIVPTPNDDENSHDVIRPVDYSASDSARFIGLSRVTGGGGDVVGLGLCKRSPSFDELCEHATKRTRTVDNHNQSLYENFPSDIIGPEKCHILGVGNENLNHPKGGEALACVDSSELLCDVNDLDNKDNGDSNELDRRGSFYMPSMPGTCADPEVFVQAHFSPRLEDDHSSDSSVLLECLSYLDYFPRKEVALGPNHQADIPAWSPPGCQSSCDRTHEKLMGTCVLPMFNAGKDVSWDAYGGNSNISADCWDHGSIRCVKQHVAEAREKLMRSLGCQKFAELGFLDMGEDVALKWSEEEEHVFHQIVLSNPASSGKNFWNVLRRVFPLRSSKDLVSYYYNVFMLAKRSQQNRSVPLSVDSDNDEWQETDDYRLTMEDYEEDYVSESPVYHESIHDDNDYEEEEEQKDQEIDDEEDASDDHSIANDDDEQRIDEMSEVFVSYKSCPTVEHDFQDDSCTSFEGQHRGVSRGLSDNQVSGSGAIECFEFNGECTNDGSSRLSDPMYNDVHYDPKSWDLYFSRSENLVDFLPTCSVIDEVFGKGAWDNETRGESL